MRTPTTTIAATTTITTTTLHQRCCYYYYYYYYHHHFHHHHHHHHDYYYYYYCYCYCYYYYCYCYYYHWPTNRTMRGCEAGNWNLCGHCNGGRNATISPGSWSRSKIGSRGRSGADEWGIFGLSRLLWRIHKLRWGPRGTNYFLLGGGLDCLFKTVIWCHNLLLPHMTNDKSHPCCDINQFLNHDQISGAINRDPWAWQHQLPLRNISDWCADLGFEKSGAPISASSVGRLRETFTELLKSMQVKGLQQFATQLPHQFVLARHLHDEAAMRIRSHIKPTPTASGFAHSHLHRGRCTSVQNICLDLYDGSSHKRPFPILLELQALRSKTSLSIATAIMQVLQVVFAALDLPNLPQQPVRYIHILVGDSIRSNTKAARLLWRALRKNARLQRLQVFLATFCCTSHQVNLCVRTALCYVAMGHVGKQQPARDHPLVLACVRFFKFLTAFYFEEFAQGLRSWL